MVAHNVPSGVGGKKSYDILTISLLTRILNIMKIGLKLMTLQSNFALFKNMFSKPEMLSDFTLTYL